MCRFLVSEKLYMALANTAQIERLLRGFSRLGGIWAQSFDRNICWRRIDHCSIRAVDERDSG
jgi:hypothetical protein